MLKQFYQNYLFLDIIEKNYFFSFDNYEWIFKNIYIRLLKFNFKTIKRKNFKFNLFWLEKLTGKHSVINLKLININKFFFVSKFKRINWSFSFIFHFFEKYLYNENIYFHLRLWKYKVTKSFTSIKLLKLSLLSKQLKFIKTKDYLEIIYFLKKCSLTKSHLSFFLPHLNKY